MHLVAPTRPPRRRFRCRGVLAGLLLIVAASFLDASPATAQEDPDWERITSFSSVIDVQDDGSVLITETIDYDFGASTGRHGIERYIPTRVPYDDVKEGYDRLYPLDVVDVSSNAPDQYSVETEDGITRIRVGDPNRTVGGAATYVLTYRIEGGLNHFDDHDELYYDVTGDAWRVPIERAEATVTLPSGEVQRTRCFIGIRGSALECDDRTSSGRTARFTTSGLQPGSGLTVVVAFPTGVVPTPEPILEERWTIQRAFAVRTDTVVPAAGLLLLGAAGVGALAYKVGRDRRFVGSPTDVAFGGEGLDEGRSPLRREHTPVEFVPPDGILPGQVGTLIDEQANPLDVTATIIDLAVRGYLRIEEVPKDHWMGKADWRLEKLSRDEDRPRLAYEIRLYRKLFEDGDVVTLSSLKNKFATHLDAVQDLLYDDSVHQGWFRRRPDETRNTWRVLGVLALVGAVAVTALLAWQTTYAVVGIPLVIVAGLLVVGAKWMPRRTAKGYAMLQRVRGFERFIEESEKDRAQFAERQHLFTEYLPYAVVFGVTEKWAKAFAGLDGQLPDQSSWYVGNDVFTAITFAHVMNGFATTSVGTMTSIPAMSGGGSSGFSGFGGGGFSGGGFGGGGGGSW